MTGAELQRARELLIVDRASIAAQLGYNPSRRSGAFEEADIIVAEGSGATISDAALNAAAEKILRPALRAAGIR